MWNTIQLALLPIAQEAQTAGTGYGGVESVDLTRYVTICVVLIVAIGGVAWGFKRLVAGNLKSRANQRSLQILDVLPLGGKQRLAVVRCYDRTFAIGLGDKEVTAIAELDPVVGRDDDGDDPTADEPSEEQTFQRALAHVQQALAKTRSGVGPAKPLRSQATRRATVAELLGRVGSESTATETTEPAAAPRRKAATHTKPKANAKAKTKTRTTADAAPREPKAARPQPTTPPRAERPVREAQGVPTLGLEGVMG